MVQDWGKVAVLLDGGYVIKRLGKTLRRSPTVQDVQRLVSESTSPPSGAPAPRLYRVLFYNADPYRGSETHPVSGQRIDFSTTRVARSNERLLRGLALCDHFAIRRGDLSFRGWRIGDGATQSFQQNPAKALVAQDLVPDLIQKGVDMRIGLDIAALALKRLADTVILFTGDADMVPAMRFARREGLQVGLCALGFSGIRRELRENADFVLSWAPSRSLFAPGTPHA